MGVRVASASETADWERATIERGTTSAELMRRAGMRAAEQIEKSFSELLPHGVAVFTGSGNNGGDGWVIAAALAQRGYPVRVIETGNRGSAEGLDAREAALRSVQIDLSPEIGNESLIVDALLGTGSTGVPRGRIAESIALIDQRRAEGARVVAVDLPSGLDATTGMHEKSVRADATISFGTLKRGHLIARDVCGDITVVDIGLDENEGADLPLLVDREWVNRRVPKIPGSAHKGTRKRATIVGGGKGMAGAAILSGEGALRSGIGLLRIVAARENAVAVHAGIPAAIVHAWPSTAEDLAHLVSNSDAVAIGPGLGKSDITRDLVERVMLAWSGPAVLDADALNVFTGDVDSLAQLVAARPCVLTPHPAELARLMNVSTDEVLVRRFEIGNELARATGAAVLLKGSPTVISSAGESRYVSASGTAALATGGSGDVLTGMVVTLLAQMCSEGGECKEVAAEAAACAAFVHGRAAELCRFVRGTTLDDILHAMPSAWNEEAKPLEPNVLSHLESVS